MDFGLLFCVDYLGMSFECKERGSMGFFESDFLVSMFELLSQEEMRRFTDLI